jgi:hypothetical protein
MTKARPINLLSLALVGVAIAALWLAGPARADSWADPKTETTLSANGLFRFTVTPADFGSVLDYFREEVAAEKSGIPVERPAPLGLLERRDAQGKWQPVWAGPLVNRIAPVEVIVAGDGRHVVTFDNWHSMGHGEHVIVIYGPDGKLVRSLALSDLLPQDFIDSQPHTVSSIQWRRDVGQFSADGASITIPVVVPYDGRLKMEEEAVPFSITLADGAVTMPPLEQWGRALESSARVIALQQQYEAERLAYLKAPLVPPQGCESSDWHDYLNEAFQRLNPGSPFDGYASTTVLYPRDNPQHRESVKWLREEVEEAAVFQGDSAFASPCNADALVVTFTKAVKKVKPGAAADATFYIAAPEPQFAAIAKLVAPTGAKTVWIDPAAAILQRPDRIPGTPEHEAALKAWRDKMDAEMAEY